MIEITCQAVAVSVKLENERSRIFNAYAYKLKVLNV